MRQAMSGCSCAVSGRHYTQAGKAEKKQKRGNAKKYPRRLLNDYCS